MSARLKNCFDRFIEVEDLSDQAVAKLARELGVDIAIDLSGLTQGSRTGIFSYRAAPIQVNWLGYPGTIGAEFIDYIIADSTIIPNSHRQFYIEKVVCLPNTYLVDDSKRVVSSRIFSRNECGLPDDSFVFCCFNNDYKFNAAVLDSWSNILHGAKQSVLWISENNPSFRNNIVVEFENRGVDANRIIFAKRIDLMADHLARYRLADLFLDTYPYNAHTTAIDSLKAGVPVLTLPGESFASRVAASLLKTIGLPELIASSPEKYEALAIDLASNPDKLGALKASLMAQRTTSPLFDTKGFTKNLEAAFLKMYERYQADLQPEHLILLD
jgi:predicted O-linked N-acetylglucosamine transferase (SPINDLY family)